MKRNNLFFSLSLVSVIALAGLFFSRQTFLPAPDEAVTAANTLTAAEKDAGWKLLFDGKTTNGWHAYGKTTIGKAWKVVGGALMLEVAKTQDGHWQSQDGGDIVTDEEYGNFELRLDWKISPCGNSGIMYRIVESSKYTYPWETGPEMQVLDNSCHPDGKIISHRAGSLYDLITVSKETVKPVGQWNKVRIVLRDGRLEQWLNGVKVVETELWTPEWDQALAKSKWKDYPDFAKAPMGRIGLQDHGNGVWFRNIKIREL